MSKMTVKFCGGEPMEIVPKYSIYREGRAGEEEDEERLQLEPGVP